MTFHKTRSPSGIYVEPLAIERCDRARPSNRVTRRAGPGIVYRRFPVAAAGVKLAHLRVHEAPSSGAGGVKSSSLPARCRNARARRSDHRAGARAAPPRSRCQCCPPLRALIFRQRRPLHRNRPAQAAHRRECETRLFRGASARSLLPYRARPRTDATQVAAGQGRQPGIIQLRNTARA